MDKEQLHVIADCWPGVWTTRAIVHALIDVGRVTAFDCQVERCILPTRTIDMLAVTPRTGRRPKDALQLDHIVGQVEYGGERLENLQLAHYVCNVARAFYGKERTEEHAAAVSAARQAHAAIPASCPACTRTFRGASGLKQHMRQSPCGKSSKIVQLTS